MRRLVDPLLIAVLAIGAWLLGRPWAGFNSPDSEFYASLALFGSDVADRSLDPAYTWTRLGYIAPVRVLTGVFGPWAGFGIWRFLLLLLIIGSIYAVVRLTSTRQLAVMVAGLAALNTVVLSFVGNTYLTGTVIAAIAVLLALACWQTLGTPRWPWLPALLSGAVVGWLAMVNPYGMLLGLSMWMGVRAVTLVRMHAERWRSLLRDLVIAVVSFGAVFGALLASGLIIFPGRNWFGTYLEWNDKLDYSTFIGDATTWQRDIALLVPVMALVIAVIALIGSRARTVAAIATVIASLNLAFTAIYLVIVPGPWLEAPTYLAKLWAGALIAVALAFAAIVRDRSLGAAGWVIAALFAGGVWWAGRWDQDLSVTTGVVIAAVVVVLVIISVVLSRRSMTTVAGIVTAIAIGSFFLAAQFEQNGRGLIGTYGQFPFRAAFVDFDGELLMSSKITAQEWILEQTSPDDRIGIWTDPDRLMASVAAMQLWGWYNNVSSGAVLDPSEADALAKLKPTAIAMYAPEREQIERFYASLPTWWLASPLKCRTIPYLGVGNTKPSICITKLRSVK